MSAASSDRGANRPLRVAIDGRALTGRYTGDRTYWRSLIRALAQCEPQPELIVLSRLQIPASELPESRAIRHIAAPAASDRLWTLFTLPRLVRQLRPDVTHVQYTAPLWCASPVVTTVHDISFRLFPEWFRPKDRLLLNLTVPGSMRRSARIITDSESSRRDILAAHTLPAAKVVATPLGAPDWAEGQNGQEADALREAARSFVGERYGLRPPFVLGVGVFQPRKNLPLLVRSFARASASLEAMPRLALVGKPGWGGQQDELAAIAAQEGDARAAAALVFPGYVPDEDLPQLYRACTVFAHPALYEGFGIPPLEALACGAPTLVNDVPAMPEVVGDAALVCPPTVEAWTEALRRLLTDEGIRADLAQRGPARAACFRWRDTAARTLQVYYEAAGMSAA